MREESAYQAIQGTKPQTLSYALTDSPVGLCAWIVEKFRTWSDCGGDVERSFGKDVLLTNVMIYWLSGAIGSSFWPYWQLRHRPWFPSATDRVSVPTGYAASPCEILPPPRRWAERAYDLRRWTAMPSGGHFAALEEPTALADMILSTPSSFIPSIFARNGISVGINRWPRPWRARNATRTPSRLPTMKASDGRPKGVSKEISSISVRASIW